MTENEIVGHEFEQTPEYNERQGGLESCSPWGSQRVRYDVAVAAAAKLLQSCPTLQPHRWQPTRFLRPWDSPGKNTGVGCCFLLPLSALRAHQLTLEDCRCIC